MCIYLRNEGFMHCHPTIISPLCVIVDGLLPLTVCTSCTDTLSHLRVTLLLFLHITLMHKRHSHRMCAVDNNIQPYMLMSFPLSSLSLLKREPAEPCLCLQLLPSIFQSHKIRIMWTSSAFLRLATEHDWMLILSILCLWLLNCTRQCTSK